MNMDPFGSARRMHQNALMGMNNNNSRRNNNNDPFQMMVANPFSMMDSMMGNMNRMMGNMDQMVNNNPNAHVYSSSTVMSYSNTGNGAPKVYQATTSTKQLPGGIKETRRAVKDSVEGIEKVAIGHHMGDKAHIIERQKRRDGNMEELVNLENLDDNEVDDFNREFEQRIHHGSHNPFAIDQHRSHHQRDHRNHPLAIDDGRKKDKKSKKSKH